MAESVRLIAASLAACVCRQPWLQQLLQGRPINQVAAALQHVSACLPLVQPHHSPVVLQQPQGPLQQPRLLQAFAGAPVPTWLAVADHAGGSGLHWAAAVPCSTPVHQQARQQQRMGYHTTAVCLASSNNAYHAANAEQAVRSAGLSAAACAAVLQQLPLWPSLNRDARSLCDRIKALQQLLGHSGASSVLAAAPMALTRVPTALRQQLEELAQLLGCNLKQLVPVLCSEWYLTDIPTADLQARISRIEQLLQLSGTQWRSQLLVNCLTWLTIDQQHLERRLGHLAAGLRLNTAAGLTTTLPGPDHHQQQQQQGVADTSAGVAEVSAASAAHGAAPLAATLLRQPHGPHLITLAPSALKARLSALSAIVHQATGLPSAATEERAVQLACQAPGVLLQQPKLLSAQWGRLQKALPTQPPEQLLEVLVQGSANSSRLSFLHDVLRQASSLEGAVAVAAESPASPQALLVQQAQQHPEQDGSADTLSALSLDEGAFVQRYPLYPAWQAAQQLVQVSPGHWGWARQYHLLQQGQGLAAWLQGMRGSWGLALCLACNPAIHAHYSKQPRKPSKSSSSSSSKGGGTAGRMAAHPHTIALQDLSHPPQLLDALATAAEGGNASRSLLLPHPAVALPPSVEGAGSAEAASEAVGMPEHDTAVLQQQWQLTPPPMLDLSDQQVWRLLAGSSMQQDAAISAASELAADLVRWGATSNIWQQQILNWQVELVAAVHRHHQHPHSNSSSSSSGGGGSGGSAQVTPSTAATALSAAGLPTPHRGDAAARRRVWQQLLRQQEGAKDVRTAAALAARTPTSTATTSSMDSNSSSSAAASSQTTGSRLQRLQFLAHCGQQEALGFWDALVVSDAHFAAQFPLFLLWGQLLGSLSYRPAWRDAFDQQLQGSALVEWLQQLEDQPQQLRRLVYLLAAPGGQEWNSHQLLEVAALSQEQFDALHPDAQYDAWLALWYVDPAAMLSSSNPALKQLLTRVAAGSTSSSSTTTSSSSSRRRSTSSRSATSSSSKLGPGMWHSAGGFSPARFAELQDRALTYQRWAAELPDWDEQLQALPAPSWVRLMTAARFDRVEQRLQFVQHMRTSPDDVTLPSIASSSDAQWAQQVPLYTLWQMLQQAASRHTSWAQQWAAVEPAAVRALLQQLVQVLRASGPGVGSPAAADQQQQQQQQPAAASETVASAPPDDDQVAQSAGASGADGEGAAPAGGAVSAVQQVLRGRLQQLSRLPQDAASQLEFLQLLLLPQSQYQARLSQVPGPLAARPAGAPGKQQPTGSIRPEISSGDSGSAHNAAANKGRMTARAAVAIHQRGSLGRAAVPDEMWQQLPPELQQQLLAQGEAVLRGIQSLALTSPKWQQRLYTQTSAAAWQAMADRYANYHRRVEFITRLGQQRDITLAQAFRLTEPVFAERCPAWPTWRRLLPLVQGVPKWFKWYAAADGEQLEALLLRWEPRLGRLLWLRQQFSTGSTYRKDAASLRTILSCTEERFVEQYAGHEYPGDEVMLEQLYELE